MRVGVYFAPAADHALSLSASRWLGRDAWSGAAVERGPASGLAADEIASLTAAPRRYGFHATLKAPFRVAEPCTLADIQASQADFTRGRPEIPLGLLRLDLIGGFFALVPERAAAAEAGALAADVVRHFDRFRAPPSFEEIARRRPETLTARQRSNLVLWGYPYVLADFRLHMTLTGPVPADRVDAVRAALAAHFADALAEPVTLDAVTLFVEPGPAADLIAHRRLALAPPGKLMDIA